MRATLILVLAWTTSAHAGELAIASDDARFHAALAEVLAPAGIGLRVTSPTEVPSIAEITAVSRAVADREHTDAMVWLVFAGDGATLIVYHRNVDRALVRSLPYRAPLSPDQAAEAARMTRTMLLALQAEPEPRPVRLAPPVIVEREPPPTVARAPRIALAVAGGVRFNGPGTQIGASVGAGVTWRPDRLGIALTARYAPAAELRGRFTGEVAARSLAVTVRRSFGIGALTLAPRAGVAVHRIAIAGTADGIAVRERALDPAAVAGATLDYPLHPAFAVGLDVSVDTLLRRQSYDAGMDTLLAVPILQVSLGVVVTARIL